MQNIKMELAYDGTAYLGWQNSIETVVQNTLERVLQHEVPVQAASRTDRGVHAEGQVINFFTENAKIDPSKLQHSLNCLLPADIRILSSQKADPDFHATLSTRSKQYVYRLYRGTHLPPFLRYTHWHILEPLDLDKMERAAQQFLGEKDFASFRNRRKGIDPDDSIRHVQSILFENPAPNVLEIKVQANNFLYKMCRNIVGTLVYVGMQKIALESVEQILAGRLRADAGITAPAHGLSLYRVFYT